MPHPSTVILETLVNSQHRFTNSDILALVPISHATLQNWVNRGLIPVEVQDADRQRRRLYSSEDATHVLFTHSLVVRGVEPAKAAPWCQVAVRTTFDFLRTGARLLRSGSTDQSRRDPAAIAYQHPAEILAMIYRLDGDYADSRVAVGTLRQNRNFIDQDHGPVVLMPAGKMIQEFAHRVAKFLNRSH